MAGFRAGQVKLKQTKRQGGLLARVLIGSFLIILTAIVIVIGFEQRAELARIEERRLELVAERDRLAAIDADLQHLQSIMDTDDYWEHIARSELGMARPHEIIIRVDD
ncbi:MAG TPA: hypothetical protein GXZ89_02560 [Fastidiosipila sp.]|jgi:cell division protein FtsB|nr:hypothetical protein [Fastidiosipila sp.]